MSLLLDPVSDDIVVYLVFLFAKQVSVDMSDGLWLEPRGETAESLGGSQRVCSLASSDLSISGVRFYKGTVFTAN